MKIGEDRYLERKDVTDNATGTYFIYQREVVIEHFAEVDDEPLEPDEVGHMSDPETTRNVKASSAARYNPVNGRGEKTHQTISYSSWTRFGPYTIS